MLFHLWIFPFFFLPELIPCFSFIDIQGKIDILCDGIAGDPNVVFCTEMLPSAGQPVSHWAVHSVNTSSQTVCLRRVDALGRCEFAIIEGFSSDSYLPAEALFLSVTYSC